MGSLTFKYQDAKYDCLTDEEKKKMNVIKSSESY